MYSKFARKAELYKSVNKNLTYLKHHGQKQFMHSKNKTFSITVSIHKYDHKRVDSDKNCIKHYRTHLFMNQTIYSSTNTSVSTVAVMLEVAVVAILVVLAVVVGSASVEVSKISVMKQ